MDNELILPALPMERILTFFDAADCAKMAQTCVTWKRIIYRRSLWEPWCLTYKVYPDLLINVPPRGARHIGAPSKACYYNWLVKIFNFRMDMFPLSVERKQDPNMFLESMYVYWIRLGSPCLIREHVRIQDLLRIPFPESLSKTEQKRILCRLVSKNISLTRNIYSHYIELQRNNLNPMLVIPHINSEDETSPDPFHRYRHAALSVQRARLEKMNTLVRAEFDKYDTAAIALMRHGISEFDLNDTWFRTQSTSVWSIACFTFRPMVILDP